MPRSRRLRLYEYVAELVESGQEVLVQELGLSGQRAHEVMLEVAKAVCHRNAKSMVYIPEAANLVNLQRNAQIWSDYQLDNPDHPFTRKFTPQRAIELAQQHDLSPQQIYNIIRGEREQEINERQGVLPVDTGVRNG